MKNIFCVLFLAILLFGINVGRRTIIPNDINLKTLVASAQFDPEAACEEWCVSGGSSACILLLSDGSKLVCYEMYVPPPPIYT